jgi:hypothetical protein
MAGFPVPKEESNPKSELFRFLFPEFLPFFLPIIVPVSMHGDEYRILINGQFSKPGIVFGDHFSRYYPPEFMVAA